MSFLDETLEEIKNGNMNKKQQLIGGLFSSLQMMIDTTVKTNSPKGEALDLFEPVIQKVQELLNVIAFNLEHIYGKRNEAEIIEEMENDIYNYNLNVDENFAMNEYNIKNGLNVLIDELIKIQKKNRKSGVFTGITSRFRKSSKNKDEKFENQIYNLFKIIIFPETYNIVFPDNDEITTTNKLMSNSSVITPTTPPTENNYKTSSRIGGVRGRRKTSKGKTITKKKTTKHTYRKKNKKSLKHRRH